MELTELIPSATACAVAVAMADWLLESQLPLALELDSTTGANGSLRIDRCSYFVCCGHMVKVQYV